MNLTKRLTDPQWIHLDPTICGTHLVILMWNLPSLHVSSEEVWAGHRRLSYGVTLPHQVPSNRKWVKHKPHSNLSLEHLLLRRLLWGLNVNQTWWTSQIILFSSPLISVCALALTVYSLKTHLIQFAFRIFIHVGQLKWRFTQIHVLEKLKKMQPRLVY